MSSTGRSLQEKLLETLERLREIDIDPRTVSIENGQFVIQDLGTFAVDSNLDLLDRQINEAIDNYILSRQPRSLSDLFGEIDDDIAPTPNSLEALVNSHLTLNNVDDYTDTIESAIRDLDAEARALSSDYSFRITTPMTADEALRQINDAALEVEDIANGLSTVSPITQDVPAALPRADIAAAHLPNIQPRGFFEKLAHRGGWIAGVGIGVYTLFTSEAEGAALAEDVARAAIPFADSAATLVVDGRPVEAAFRGAEETGIGLLATEFGRPLARLNGMDADSGIVEGVVAEPVNEATNWLASVSNAFERMIINRALNNTTAFNY